MNTAAFVCRCDGGAIIPNTGDETVTRNEAFKILDLFPTRKVCKAVQSDSELADAIFEIRSRGQKHWDKAEWGEVLAELDRCRLPVAQWLELEALIL